MTWASLVAQRLKRLPAMQETRVQSLRREDPLEKEVATHSSILAWRIPWKEEPGGLQYTGWSSLDVTMDISATSGKVCFPDKGFISFSVPLFTPQNVYMLAKDLGAILHHEKKIK